MTYRIARQQNYIRLGSRDSLKKLYFQLTNIMEMQITELNNS
jgi:hypothetical protein